MITRGEPLVNVFTPVYNGEEFLCECIESVLAQTYRNFSYTIVNNKSTDRSLEIALAYAGKDSRVRVVSNETFVGVIDNHNIAFRMTSPDAKYCKIVSADDVIFPDCIEKMVAAAEANPSAGLVGCYQLSGTGVRWQGYPYPKTLIDGRELCRQMLLMRGSSYGFGSGAPTSLLYRADLVRRTEAFFPNHSPHADTSACYECLKDLDFAFVYQVLCFERVGHVTQSSQSSRVREDAPATLNDIIKYGRSFLNPDEYDRKYREFLRFYYERMAIEMMAGRGSAFLEYHRKRLGELGHPLKLSSLFRAGAAMLLREMINPEQLFAKVKRRFTASST